MELRERIAGLMPQARDELGELVAIRSVADPRQFPPEECAAAAQWVLGKFSELGFSDVHLAETADGSQAVVGSRRMLRHRRHLPSCCTRTTTFSRLSTRPRGELRRSSSPRSTAAGTAAARPTARATSSCTWHALCALWATRYRSI